METTQSCHRTKYLAHLSAKILKSSVTKTSTEVPFNSKKNNLLEKSWDSIIFPRNIHCISRRLMNNLTKVTDLQKTIIHLPYDHAPCNAQKWFLPKHSLVLPGAEWSIHLGPSQATVWGKTQVYVSRCGRSRCLDDIVLNSSRKAPTAVCLEHHLIMVKTHHARLADPTAPAQDIDWAEGRLMEAVLVLQLNLNHSHTFKPASSRSLALWCCWHSPLTEVHVHRPRQPRFIGIQCT